jgi:DNA-directed RNA polymerase subunit RPC12/RpoP
MICLNCKKQISDDSERCPYCGSEVDHREQVKREIGFRRYQRWFFYIFFAIMFIGMIIAIVMIYNQNTKLLLSMETAKKELGQKDEVIKTTQITLEEKLKVLEDLQKNLTEKDTEIAQKTETFKKVVDEKALVDDQYKNCQVDLSSADANIYSLIIKIGAGISDRNLNKIPLADANLDGVDTDADGLSDQAENAFGTDINKIDSDGDGFNDKTEILGGYNPMGTGEIGIDPDFAVKQKGKILLQVEKSGEAWYVGQDARRYFLGTPADAFKIMRGLEYWTKDFNSKQ